MMKTAALPKHLCRTSALTAILLFMAVALQDCAPLQAPAPARPAKTIDLLVDASVMPPGWIIFDRHELTKDAHHLSVGNSAEVAFKIEGIAPAITRQEIHRYRNSTAAKGVYAEFIRPVGKIPPGWTYHSSVADESVFACYDYEGREPYPVCEWAARYEEYVVIVRSWLVTDQMTLQDLEKVIQAIDTQMAQQLGRR
jgi:hypothetical protein